MTASPAVAAPRLVRDINSERVIASSQPREFVRIGDTVYFIATTTAAGDGLWKSDGTAAGTVLVRGFGTTDGEPHWLTALGDQLLLSVLDPVTGRELWRSDGTTAGTGPLVEITPGPIGAEPRYLTRVGQRVFFAADDGEDGDELWVTDGSVNGTRPVADIAPGPDGSFPVALVGLDDMLYFSADDGEHGAELWASDGNSAQLVRDINPGLDSGALSLVAASDRLYLIADDGEHGAEPWVSDGSGLGTRLARDILPGPDGSEPSGLIASGMRAFFSAFAAASGEELYVSDGSEAGTLPVRDINPGAGGSFPFWLTPFAGGCAFTADDGTSGEEVWVSDGTPGGTQRVADLRPGPDSSIPTELVAAGAWLFFSACPQPDAPCRLMRTDGSAPGTLALRDFVDSADGVGLGDALYLGADDGVSGSEPWVSDGSVEGTRQLANLATDDAIGSAYPIALTALRRQVLFVADDGVHGAELWRSGGTEASTTMVRDINPEGSAFGLVAEMARLGDYVFFVARDAEHGAELWRTDGTEEGTELWEDTANDPTNSGPRDLTPVDDTTLFFVADEGLFGAELWRTNNAGETTPITDIRPGQQGSQPRLLTPFRGGIAFTADDGVRGVELWRSDGTPAGTRLVRDINPNGSAFLPTGVFYTAVIDDILYFTADDGTHGVELWRSDGTADGTRLVRDIRPGPESSDPQFLRAAPGGPLALIADDGEHGLELWRSDGSEAGTSMVTDINPLTGAFSTVTFFFSFGDLDPAIYFAADDGSSGVELWRSDLTADGTVRLADINPGPAGSYPAFFTARDGAVIFQAFEPLSGFEPWQATAGGAVARYADLAAGSESSNPTLFTPIDERVFFSADGAGRGTELWIDAPCAGDCGGDAAVSIDELIRGVRIAEGADDLGTCLSLDRNGDEQVTVDELIAAVSAALNGC